MTNRLGGGKAALLGHWRVGLTLTLRELPNTFFCRWLMLGQKFQTDPARKAHIRELAEQIAYTCWQMYEQQPTGIAPERVKSMKMDLSKTDTREYILRPEALEGFWCVCASFCRHNNRLSVAALGRVGNCTLTGSGGHSFLLFYVFE